MEDIRQENHQVCKIVRGDNDNPHQLENMEVNSTFNQQVNIVSKDQQQRTTSSQVQQTKGVEK